MIEYVNKKHFVSRTNVTIHIDMDEMEGLYRESGGEKVFWLWKREDKNQDKLLGMLKSLRLCSQYARCKSLQIFHPFNEKTPKSLLLVLS
jgi:hypothetical protein